MKFEILQIVNHHTPYFLTGYRKATEYGINLNDYQVVCSGNIKNSQELSVDEILESLYEKFNISKPDDFKGHSLSVSDIIKLDNTYYYCDYTGFEKLDKEEL